MTGGIIVLYLILGVALGLLGDLMGIYMIVTGDSRTLHSYHYATTAPQDVPKLVRWCGAGLLALGLAATLTVVFYAKSTVELLPDWAGDVTVIFIAVVLWTAGIATIFASIRHFNGAIFS